MTRTTLYDPNRDSDDVVKLNDKHQKFDLNQPVMGAAVVRDEDGKLIGFGAIKIIYELVLVLDQDVSQRIRVEAARDLMTAGISVSQNKNIKFWHAFCDKDFAQILKKWFGFRKCDGEAVILEVR